MLIVFDKNPINLAVVGQTLRDAGLEVIECDSISKLLRHTQSKPTQPGTRSERLLIMGITVESSDTTDLVRFIDRFVGDISILLYSIETRRNIDCGPLALITYKLTGHRIKIGDTVSVISALMQDLLLRDLPGRPIASL